MVEPRRETVPVMDAAACVGHSAIFDSAADSSASSHRVKVSIWERKAIDICNTCPLREACLRWALAVDDQWSVLGGKTAAQRREMVRRGLA